MKNIYFVRHGESVENESGILAGGDSPLSEKGRKEAEMTAERVKKLNPDALVSSHYARAKETAAAISLATGLLVEVKDFLFESKYPSKNIGKSMTDGEARDTALYIHDRYSEEDYKHEDAESFTELKGRARQAVALLENHSGENIVVVTHGNFLRLITGVMLFPDNFTGAMYADMIHGFATKNTGITWCKYSPAAHKKPWRIMTWNDHSHLG